ncbi:Major facilitator superfamily domain containing 10 [Fasciola gigantica]|uniref:Major facilitator superfamily domain containing 10 n=1 Tax=Fasciola gigantica TaxID=46835 RepID=A0A504Y6B1_FASGI|nr:Major facilitator superfamily domain containing 10 [Fasciola gigantica]
MTKAGDACLRRLSLIYFLYLFLFSGLEFTLLFLTRSRFGYTSQDQGRMFSFLGIVMILVQAGLIRRFQIDQMYLGTVSIFSLSIASVILGGAWNKWLFYTGLLLFAFASAAFVPSVHATISLLAKPHRQGHVLGLVRSLNALARSVGPVSVSFTFWSIGSFQCFVLCGCILWVLCFLHFRTRIPLRSLSRL